MQPLTDKKRIEWIDAMRGFTMILVVFSHMELFGIDYNSKFTGINSLFVSFFMPLFFFISGFVSFKHSDIWDFKHYRTKLLEKTRIQLLPTLFFGLLYATLLFSKNEGVTPFEGIMKFFDHSFKLGYWFTIALLGMFAIYYSVSFILNKCKLTTRQIILVIISLILYYLCFRSNTNFSHNQVARILCLYKIFFYFQFFIFGNLVSCYREKVFKMLDNKYIITTILLFFAVLFVIYSHQPDITQNYIRYSSTKIIAEGVAYLGVITVIAVFRHYKYYFSKNTKIGQGLQYIGRRTLDIYLLHFFLIPSIPSIGKFFSANNNLVLETTVVIGLSLMVILFCLIISNIIRISPLLGHYLFGAKLENKNTKRAASSD